MSHRLGQNQNPFLKTQGPLPPVSPRGVHRPLPAASGPNGPDQFGQFLEGLQTRPVNLERPKPKDGNGALLDLSA